MSTWFHRFKTDVNNWVRDSCCQSDLIHYVLDDGKYQYVLDGILNKKQLIAAEKLVMAEDHPAMDKFTAAEQRVVDAFAAYQNLAQGQCDGIIDFPKQGVPGNEKVFVDHFGFSVFDNWLVYVGRIDNGQVEFSRRFWDDIAERMDGLLRDVLSERASQ
jgi:hypothetical protein